MAHAFFACLVALAVWVVTILVNRSKQRQRAYSQGCRPLPHYRHIEPLFGSDLLLLTVRNMIKNNNLASVHKRFLKYGPTYQTRFTTSDLIITKDPKLIQHVYIDNERDWGVAPARLDALEPFCGIGFITTDGEAWEHSRGLMRPLFSKSRISDLSFLSATTDTFIGRLPRDGSMIDLQPLLCLFMVDVAAEFVLGQPMGAFVDEKPEDAPLDAATFLKHFQTSLQACAIRIVSGRLRNLIPHKKWNMSFEAVQNQIDYFVTGAIDARQDEKGISPSLDDATNSDNSLLAGLIELTSDRIEIRNHIIQAIMAAQDTSSLLIANAMFLLSRHPSVWASFREEARAIASDSITYHSLTTNKYLRNLLNEVFRMYAVFPLLMRTALRDTILPAGGGPNGDSPVFVAAGTTIEFCFYSIHRDPSVFGSDADEFRPDRWDTVKPSIWEFIPFGHGPRQCLGQQKARLEASYVLVRLALAFKELHSRDDRPWMAEERLSARNANGCKVALVPA